MFAEVDKQVTLNRPRYICLKTCLDNPSSLYELNWLNELLDGFNVEPVLEDTQFKSSDKENLVIVIIRNKWLEQIQWLSKLRLTHTFKIIHLGDEYATDPIHMYSWSEVSGVMRTYSRPDLGTDKKILVIPLGYHHQAKSRNSEDRKIIWSFAGTNWKGRSDQLQILQAIQPNSVHWYSEWKDSKQLVENDYISLLTNSIFVACPRGQNIETYRFYEALECGCIPLFISSEVPNLDIVSSIPFLKLQSWDHAAALMQHFQNNAEQLEEYRNLLLTSWTNYKVQLKDKINSWLKN